MKRFVEKKNNLTQTQNHKSSLYSGWAAFRFLWDKNYSTFKKVAIDFKNTCNIQFYQNFVICDSMFCIVKNSNYIKTSKLRTLATSNPYTAILKSLVYYIFQFCFYAYTNIYRDFLFNLENNRSCILYFFSIYCDHLSMSIQIFLLEKKTNYYIFDPHFLSVP